MQKGNRIIASLLIVSFFLTACSPINSAFDETAVNNTISEDTSEENVNEISEVDTPVFTTISDPELREYLENTIGDDISENLDSEKYSVESIETLYYSKEFIEEMDYNSKENIYFGYTLKELEEQFKGKKYIFTLDENGQTIAKEFETYDESQETWIRDTAIGAGVILLCVTVTVLVPGTGAKVAGESIKTIVAVSSPMVSKVVENTTKEFISNMVSNSVETLSDPDAEFDIKETFGESVKQSLENVAISAISGKTI